MNQQDETGFSELKIFLKSLKEEIQKFKIEDIPKEIIVSSLLDKISEANIRIQQFKVKFGVKEWENQKQELWDDLNRLEVALNRRFERLEFRKKKWRTLGTIVAVTCALISAGAAVYSVKQAIIASKITENSVTIGQQALHLSEYYEVNKILKSHRDLLYDFLRKADSIILNKDINNQFEGFRNDLELELDSKKELSSFMEKMRTHTQWEQRFKSFPRTAKEIAVRIERNDWLSDIKSFKCKEKISHEYCQIFLEKINDLIISGAALYRQINFELIDKKKKSNMRRTIK